VKVADAGSSQPIPAVARFRERVGRESKAHAEADELVDDRLVLPCIEVVHELRPLVADKSMMLESRRTLHGADGTSCRRC
jgi:hypothetical protein